MNKTAWRLVLLCTLISIDMLKGQIFCENFDEVGVGVFGFCNEADITKCGSYKAPCDGKWHLTNNGKPFNLFNENSFVQVQNDRIEARYVNGQICLESKEIDISAFDKISITYRAGEIFPGKMELEDSMIVDIVYEDGSTYSLCGYRGGFGFEDYFLECMSVAKHSSIHFNVCFTSNSPDEWQYIDQLRVVECGDNSICTKELCGDTLACDYQIVPEEILDNQMSREGKYCVGDQLGLCLRGLGLPKVGKICWYKMSDSLKIPDPTKDVPIACVNLPNTNTCYNYQISSSDCSSKMFFRAIVNNEDSCSFVSKAYRYTVSCPTIGFASSTGVTNCNNGCNGSITIESNDNSPFGFTYSKVGGTSNTLFNITSPYTLGGLCEGEYKIIDVIGSSCLAKLDVNRLTINVSKQVGSESVGAEDTALCFGETINLESLVQRASLGSVLKFSFTDGNYGSLAKDFLLMEDKRIYVEDINGINGCSTYTSFMIKVNELTDTKILNSSISCIEDKVFELNALPVGGVWKGKAIFEDKFVDLDSIGIGRSFYTYIFSDPFSKCESRMSFTLNINDCLLDTVDLAIKNIAVKENINSDELFTYHITVFNQGTAIAYDILVNDYITSDIFINPNLNKDWNINGNTLSTTIGQLNTGDSVVLTLIGQLNSTSKATEIINNAEICASSLIKGGARVEDIDSRPCNNSNSNPELNCDNIILDKDNKNTVDDDVCEDDFDPAVIKVFRPDPVYDMAIKKKYEGVGIVEPGDDLTFNIEVYNQGNATAYDIKVTDYLPESLHFTSSKNPKWNVEGSNVYYIVDSVPANGKRDIFITLQLDPLFIGDKILNNAEICGFSDKPNGNVIQDQDSKPCNGGGLETDCEDGITGIVCEDDYDGVNVSVKVDTILDLALLHRLALASQKSKNIYKPGDDLTLEFLVVNQGRFTAHNVRVQTLLSNGLVTFDKNWKISTGGIYTQSIPSILSGDSVLLTMLVRIEENYTLEQIINNAEIVFASLYSQGNTLATDVDSEFGNNANTAAELSCDNIIVDKDTKQTIDNDDCEDDYDPLVLNIDQTNLFDLALMNEVKTPGPHILGDTVEFYVKVFNQGKQNAYDVDVKYYPVPGLIFVPSLNPDWTKDIIYTFDHIAVGGDVEKSIWFVVDKSYTKDEIIINAEIVGDALFPGGGLANDIDSKPNNNSTTRPELDADNQVISSSGGSINGKSENSDDFDPALLRLSPTQASVFEGPITICNTDNTYSLIVGTSYTTDGNPYNANVGGINFVVDEHSATVGEAVTGKDTFSNSGFFPNGETVTVNLDDTIFTFVEPKSCGGQISVACVSDINVSIDAMCNADLDVEDVLLGIGTGSVTGFYIKYISNKAEVSQFTGDHIGKNNIYELIDNTTGSKCWGNVKIERKSIPATIIDEVTLACAECMLYDTISVDSVRKALMVAGCFDGVKNMKLSKYETGQVCGELTVVREITGDLQIGSSIKNVLIYKQTIIKEPINIDSIKAPDASVVIDCHSILDENFTPENLAKLFPGGKHSPYYGSGSVTLSLFNDPNCNYTYKYTDQTFKGQCPKTWKILRDWEILDICTGKTRNFKHWIQIVDTIKPIIMQPLGDDTVSVGDRECSASYLLPKPSATDLCSGEQLIYSWVASQGKVVNGVLKDLWLSEGTVQIVALVSDSCGNTARDTFLLTVVDKAPPKAICHDEVRISIAINDGSAEAVVPANRFDGGSHDNGCGEVSTCVVRAVNYNSGALTYVNGKEAKVDGGRIFKYVEGCEGYDGIFKDTILNQITGKISNILEVPYVGCKSNLTFCCADQNKKVMVALVVTDDADNTAVCMSVANIANKTRPVYSCYSDTVKCEDLSTYVPKAPQLLYANCNTKETQLLESSKDLGNCGNGSVTNVWWTDFNNDNIRGNDEIYSCKAVVVKGKKFDPLSIKWPLHYNGTTIFDPSCNDKTQTSIYPFRVFNGDFDKDGDLDDVTYSQYATLTKKDPLCKVEISMYPPQKCEANNIAEPTWTQSNCDQIALSSEDIIRQDVAGASCKTILRKWAIVDWCTYKAGSENDDNDNGFFDVTDFDMALDAQTGRWCFRSKGINDIGDNERQFQFDEDGYYTFVQTIEIRDEDAPKITDCNSTKYFDVADASCRARLVVNNSAKDTGDCFSQNLMWKGDLYLVDGNTEKYLESKTVITINRGNASFDFGLRDFGNYKIVWTVSDGCGNNTTCSTNAIIRDVKAPSMICLAAMSTSIMPQGAMVEYAAKNFIKEVTDNCTPPSGIKISFHPTNYEPSRIFNCSNLGNLPLKIYVTDFFGNTDHCDVTLRVDDNNKVCPQSIITENSSQASIVGTVQMPNGIMIEDVNINLTQDNKHLKSNKSTVDGQYSFQSIDAFSHYQVSGDKQDAPNNGVTTLDIAIIQDHILGIKSMVSPYQIIAADVDEDGEVNSSDILEIRKMIMGLSDHNLKSWRFVDQSQVFVDKSNPNPVKEKIIANTNARNNFVGIKLGDVDQTAIANSQQVTSRSESTLYWFMKKIDQKIQWIANGDYNLAGFQFNTNIDKISSLKFTLDYHNIRKHSNGVISVSWNPENGVPLNIKKGDVLFEFDLNAYIIDKGLRPELYLKTETGYQTYALGTSADPEEDFRLENHPNPFSTSTTINYFNPYDNADIRLEVFDGAGRQVVAKHFKQNRGENKLTLTGKELGQVGLYYYRVVINETISKKSKILYIN